ncbi:MAG: inositol monophosphatase [Alphaproteobacteria bacterium]|nr:inositol monophosphatase [Alphaproteobacteria bacterium]
MSLTRRYEFGLSLIRDAGELALGYFNNRTSLSIQSKGPQDMASEADLNTELLVKSRLAEAFPEDAFLGEETGRTGFAKDQGIWVVDPIDGTQPFICGLTSWCVSIAFVSGGAVQFGMVYAPARDELFAGGAGHAATLNGQPIRGARAASVKDGLIGAGFSPKSGVDQFLPAFERFLRAGGMFYRDGSGALGLCYVASGRLIGFFEPVIKSWDCLGAVAVVQAAGLRTNDFLAGDGLFSGNPIIAGNDAVYAELSALAGYA